MAEEFVRSDDVRRGNRRRVIAATRRHGPISRTELGQVTGLSAATVSTITSDLIAEGVLAQPRGPDRAPGGRGRPQVQLSVNPHAAMVAIAIFRLNRVSAAIVKYSGDVVSDVARPLPTLTAHPREIRSGIEDCLREVMERAGGGPVSRIAVGVQGVTDIEGTELWWSPVTRFRHLPMAAWLEETFQVPVNVSNDCNLMAKALNWREPDHYRSNFAAVLLSHGVGMGLFLRGQLVNGTRSSATEFGHMVHIPGGALCRCGGRGCIEAYAGDYAIERAARGEPQHLLDGDVAEPPDLNTIAAAARAGDHRARAAFKVAGEALGTGFAGLYALVDPFPIALVGSGTMAFDLIEKPLRETLGRTMDGSDAADIEIDCYPDETTLVREGCAIDALARLDEEFAISALEIEGS